MSRPVNLVASGAVIALGVFMMVMARMAGPYAEGAAVGFWGGSAIAAFGLLTLSPWGSKLR